MYAHPPFDETWTTGDPENNHRETKPQDWHEDTGTFYLTITHPPLIQRGTTVRFKFKAAHVLDGAIGISGAPFSTPLTPTILDRYQQAALASYFSVGTVTNYPVGSNEYYADVQVQAVCELDWFEVKWAAGYTPVAGPPALEIQKVQSFRIYEPTRPSSHYFYDTKTFGAR